MSRSLLPARSVGIWTSHLDFVDGGEVRDAVAEVEELGFRAIWVGENVGREPFVLAGQLLSATSRLTVATGVASIWARDAAAATAAHFTLAEAHPDRFLLGLGVSHARLVASRQAGAGTDRGPLEAMRSYLAAMDSAAGRYRAVKPARAPRLLAALGPEMTRLAGELTDGALSYFVPPEHTAVARELLGPDRLLAVEQAVVLDTDPRTARATARRHVRRYLPLVNYTRNLRRLGFDDADVEHEGSDRLVDAIVAWGDLDAIAARITAHFDAGADHVCLQAVLPDDRALPRPAWRELSTLL